MIGRVLALSLLTAAVWSAPARAGAGARLFDPDEPFAHLSWSPDGRYLAIGRQDGATILLHDARTGETTDLNTGRASGNQFAWSPDGRKLGYKQVDCAVQRAMVRDVASGAAEVVAAGPLVGQVAWLDDTSVVVTSGSRLELVSGSTRRGWDIGGYVNQIAVDRGGSRAAFCRGQEAVLVDLANGEQRVIARAGADLFGPRFSPSGGRLLVCANDGSVQVIELSAGGMTNFGSGSSPSWLDGRTVLFTRKRHQAMALAGSELVAADAESGAQAAVAADGIAFPGMAASTVGRIALASLGDGSLLAGELGVRGGEVTGAAALPLDSLTLPRWERFTDARATKGMVPGWMPYIHQVYDTPDSFDGSAACGPTSCLMAIGSYHRYAVWNETIHVGANPPGTHVSPYGNYDSKIYAYGGYVFDDTCSPPSGPPAHGAYGHCCEHGTGAGAYKCQSYIQKHDLSSEFDGSVSWSDITAQVDAGHPVVLSTRITSAGHLMCVRGYIDGQHTIVVNDPAGNRNHGAYWNYPGDNARYDWPGYNNGYVNINTASWLVTARGRHTRLSLADYPDTVDAGHYYTVTFRDTTSRYQTNNTFTVDVCDGGSGAVLFSAQRAGLNDSNGGIWNVFNLTAPRTSSSIYFKSYLSPAGGSYDTRYISDWTDDAPTVVKPVTVHGALTNPGLESGTAPWADTENATLAWDTVHHSGSRSLRVTPRVLTDYVPAVAHQDVAVTPGQPYCFSGWARKNDGAGNQVRLCLMWYAAADTQIGSMVSSAWLTADDPAFHFLRTDTVAAPAGAAYACLRLYVKGYAAAGDNFDDLSFGPGTGVAGEPPGIEVAGRFLLAQNRPNPFGRSTAITYQLPAAGIVRLAVYNVAGQKVRTLADGPWAAGRHEARWDGRDEQGAEVGAGMYYYRIETGGRSDTRRMLIIR